MMRNVVLTLACLTALAGCHKQTPQQQATDDAREVAQVERLSKAPFKIIAPTPIGPEDVARYGLDRPGCSFFKNDAEKAGGAPLFIAARDEGFLLIDGNLKRYAANKAAADLPGGARTTYTGLAEWVDLVRQPDDANSHSSDVRWPAQLILHDSQERVAFMATGTVVCHGS